MGCNEIAAMDLFIVPTLAFGLLYGFLIVRLDRRELRLGRRDEKPHSRLDCTPDQGSVPLGSAGVPDPRPRPRLWLNRTGSASMQWASGTNLLRSAREARCEPHCEA